MDRFLSSNYGEKSISYHNTSGEFGGKRTQRSMIGPGGGGGSNMLSYLSSNSQIRPSVSFIGPTRDEIKERKYVDLNNGPSPMQLMGNQLAFKDLNPDKKMYYEKDRDNHLGAA